ncbi:MAG: hypothetical protein V8Q36_10245 [Anaerotignum sp.]
MMEDRELLKVLRQNPEKRHTFGDETIRSFVLMHRETKIIGFSAGGKWKNV